MGGKFHLKLNIGTRPIANKYREGKMKSTLKRELKVRETVTREPIEVSSARRAISLWYRRPVAEAAQAPCCGGGDYPRCTCPRRESVSVCGTGEGVQKGDSCASGGVIVCSLRRAADRGVEACAFEAGGGFRRGWARRGTACSASVQSGCPRDHRTHTLRILA